ncbi:MAG TPA: HepT-like ribonuclease domain-containing protein [Homoserinimonas sp.]|nr:HepT-like ribonuclease domain-containing protein [Homoserinimonas sp.]
MKRTDRQELLEAVRHLEVVRGHLAQSTADDQLVLDAAALRLSAAIDSVSRVPDELRRQVLEDSAWRAIEGMRNRLVDAYSFIDAAVMRTALARDIKKLEADIRLLLDQAGE